MKRREFANRSKLHTRRVLTRRLMMLSQKRSHKKTQLKSQLRSQLRSQPRNQPRNQLKTSQPKVKVKVATMVFSSQQSTMMHRLEQTYLQ